MYHDVCYENHGLKGSDNFKNLPYDQSVWLQSCNQKLCDALTSIINTSNDPWTGEPLNDKQKKGASTIRSYFSDVGVASCGHPIPKPPQ